MIEGAKIIFSLGDKSGTAVEFRFAPSIIYYTF